MLHFANGETKWYLPEEGAAGIHYLKVQLPQHITCSQCILQWRYRTGKNKKQRILISLKLQQQNVIQKTQGIIKKSVYINHRTLRPADCRDIEFLARVQPLISRIVHISLNQLENDYYVN